MSIAVACRDEVRGVLQNKGLIKWAFCNWLILNNLNFCGQVDTKGCARWKRNSPHEVQTGMHSGLFGLFVAELSTRISTELYGIYINVKLNLGGFARAGGLGRPPHRIQARVSVAAESPECWPVWDLRFRGWRGGGGRGSGLGGGERLAVEGEVLGFVAEDGAKEGVVIGGALGGDLP